MLVSKDAYGIKQFRQKDVSTKNFHDALQIYVDSTGGETKTIPHQITYWAERNPEEFSSCGDIVHTYGFFKDDKVVGFALCFYISETCLYVIDHIAIDSNNRGMSAFDHFSELIYKHVLGQRLCVNFFVVEVSTGANDADPLLNDETLTRLLQIKGFRVADIHYETPSSKKKPPYKSSEARLLLRGSNSNTRIKMSELMEIIKSIHCGLYLNWYKPFNECFEKYREHLNGIYDNISSHDESSSFIPLNGHPPMKYEGNIHKIPGKIAIVSGVFIASLVASVFVSVVMGVFSISEKHMIGASIAVSVLVIAVASIWHERAARTIQALMDKFPRLFGS